MIPLSIVWTRLTLLACVLLSVSIPGHAQNVEGPEGLYFEVEDLREDQQSGLLIDRVYFLLHDGTFNLFDFGKPAPEGLRWFANHGFTDRIADELWETGFEWATGREIPLELPTFNGANAVEGFPGPVVHRSARYLTYFARIYPSDDGFIGNEDPRRYEVFDENGQFQGPIVIDVYGTDILDAGTKENLEQDLLGLDRHLFDERGDPFEEPFTTDPVMPHPGFNGSYRNPDGEPARLMVGGETYCQDSGTGGSFCHEYDPASIDFSQPGRPLMRLRVSAMRQIFHGAWSGSYFNPERSGEGFNFEFFDENPPRALFYWYTYKPDGSGDPMWLIGEGFLGEANTMEFEIYETTGGQMTAPTNPDTVDVIPWGTASIRPQFNVGHPACRGLRLYLTPQDQNLELDLPTGGLLGTYLYELEALTTDLTKLDHYCGNRTSVNVLPTP